MINSISGKYLSVKVKLFQYFLIQTCAHANGLTVREKTVDTITEQNYSYSQGHPMDLFLKISVLQAYFCWLGDVKEIIVLGRKVLLGKR